MIKLSIIIPVYNCCNYISSCVESIIVSKKKFELILVDDGSTDDSLIICNEYAKKDSRIKVIHKSNGGVSSARNIGLDHAKGDYIMFVDADDKLSSDWDKVFNYINNEDIYYFSNINENSKVDELLEYICGSSNKKICIGGPYSKAFNKNIIIDNNILFDENVINGEDMLFNIKVLLCSKAYKIVNFSFYYYRQAIGQSTRKFNEKIIQSDMAFHNLLYELLAKYNINKIVVEKIKTFCLNNAIITILNNMSYSKKYKDIEKLNLYFEKEPYKSAVYSPEEKGLYSIIFNLLKNKKYKFVFYILKIKNKISIFLKHKVNGQFIKI